MPFLSTVRHALPYVPTKGQDRVLEDIGRLIDSIRTLDIHAPTKKRMLVHALWEVAVTTGNFYPRYRSQAVVQKAGIQIQRDHIFQKRRIIQRLIEEPTFSSAEAVQNAQCCVVTREEHDALHKIDPTIDGFRRYDAAGIAYRDMQE